VFHNSIDNLIENQAVAVTTSGQSIYSYRNILRAFTQGIEYGASYPIIRNVTFSAGYQLLFAKDKDVVQIVKKGEVYWRDPYTLVTRQLHPQEYFGLYNRSRHMGNAKLFYESRKTGWEGSVRVIYRGKYGIGDIRGNIQGETIPPSDNNNNGILDTHDQFIAGYALINVSVAKKFKNGLRVQGGIDNLFNHTEPIYIPNLPGRLWYTSVSYTLTKK
jgi:outer membrane receptor for ferrienterochelin and colicins